MKNTLKKSRRYRILFLMAIVPNLCFADIIDYACSHLKISIKNNTQNNCYLLNEEYPKLKYPYTINPKQDISFKIHPNETTTPLDISPYFFIDSISIVLIYECGEGAYITLSTYKNACQNLNEVTWAVLNTSTITASAETSPANYWQHKPAEITWTLE